MDIKKIQEELQNTYDNEPSLQIVGLPAHPGDTVSDNQCGSCRHHFSLCRTDRMQPMVAVAKCLTLPSTFPWCIPEVATVTINEGKENEMTVYAALSISDGVIPEDIKKHEKIGALTARVEQLKAELAGADYKITKCDECSLCDLPLPYDIQALHAERQAKRDEISDLEEQIKKLLDE